MNKKDSNYTGNGKSIKPLRKPSMSEDLVNDSGDWDIIQTTNK